MTKGTTFLINVLYKIARSLGPSTSNECNVKIKHLQQNYTREIDLMHGQLFLIRNVHSSEETLILGLLALV